MKRIISVFITASMLLLLAVSAFSFDNTLELIPTRAEYSGNGGYIFEEFSEDDNSGGVHFSNPRKNSRRNSLPSSFDSRNNNWISPVKNQGEYGSCWSFATMAALESDGITKGYFTKDSVDFSESHLVWFTYNINNIDGHPNNGEGGRILNGLSPYNYGGNRSRAIFSLAHGIGLANEESFPYSPYFLNEMGNYSDDERFNHNSGYALDNAYYLNSASAVKEWIMLHGACTVAINMDTAYYNYNNNCYYTSSPQGEGHAITIVGWDDNYSKSNFLSSCAPSADGAWLVKNSYGISYGDYGYFWLSYYDSSIREFTGYEITPVEENDKLYSRTSCHTGNRISLPSNGRIANVYTANGNDKLTEVGIFCEKENASVKVDIYKNLPSGYVNPTDGVLAISFTVAINLAGYFSLDIPQEITVSDGEIFSVVLTFTSADGKTVSTPIEYNSSNLDAVYTFNAKESYFSTNSYGSFNDCYNQNFGNFYINVFAQSYNPVLHDYQISYSWSNDGKFCVATATDNLDNEFFLSENASITSSVYVQPTCEGLGTTRYTASFDNDLFETQTKNVIDIPANGHCFSSWSKFKDIEGTNLTEHHRECSSCDKTESEKFIKGTKTYTLDELLARLFMKILEIFKKIYKTE